MIDAIRTTETDWLLYDGECPFCRNFVHLMRLRELSPTFQLLNAREQNELVNTLLTQGYDVDKGMVLYWRSNYYYGADCISKLTALVETDTAGRLISRLLFGKAAIARILYPWLVRGRRLTLLLLGRKTIKGNKY